MRCVVINLWKIPRVFDVMRCLGAKFDRLIMVSFQGHTASARRLRMDSQMYDHSMVTLRMNQWDTNVNQVIMG